tara:strand:- start:613 stop:1005 length:393 start_codon:yes stop_codon:yes gene_type:complete
MIDLKELPDDLQINIWRMVYKESINSINTHFDKLNEFVAVDKAILFRHYDPHSPSYQLPTTTTSWGKGVFMHLNHIPSCPKNSQIQKDFNGYRKRFFPNNGYHSRKAMRNDLRYSKLFSLNTEAMIDFEI